MQSVFNFFKEQRLARATAREKNGSSGERDFYFLDDKTKGSQISVYQNSSLKKKDSPLEDVASKGRSKHLNKNKEDQGSEGTEVVCPQ